MIHTVQIPFCKSLTLQINHRNVANWILSKNELKMEPVMQLKLVTATRDDPEEANLAGLAGGSGNPYSKFSVSNGLPTDIVVRVHRLLL